ncbi:MAG: D-alanyl-D-alanine carboxypeptidase family protein [Paracoccaceae bacterium]
MLALKGRLFASFVGLLLSTLCAESAFAQSQGTPASAAIVIDMTSGAVLLEKNADQPLPPASMSKLMTLFMVFEALEQGRISMGDTFRTSKRASQMGGSKMFLREGGLVSVEDLIRGVIVQSGNDAAVAIAEALAGTEETFAERMTQRGRDLGLENSVFANSTGWPDQRQLMTVRDLAKLAGLLVERFPNYYPMFAETDFTWDGVAQKNRNPLLNLGVRPESLKTGHTEEAGYGLVASAIRGQRRIVMVVSGLESKGERRHEAERLINWSFRAFETRELYAAGEGIIDAPVWIGSSATVTLAPERDVMVTAPFGTLDKAELKIRYEGPVPAPIAEGQAIGYVEIDVPELSTVKIPLVAKQAVETGGFLTRMQAAGQLLLEPLFPG